MSKYIELAKKLKALAERGEGGEKENAQKMLDELMQKYDISMDEIELDKREDRMFKGVKPAFSKLFAQVVYAVIGKDWDGVGKSLRYPSLRWVKCSAAEKIEIEVRFSIYCRAYVKEIGLFYEAFIQANGIFPIANESTSDEPEKELSLEERQKQYKILSMSQGIEKVDIHKQLRG